MFDWPTTTTKRDCQCLNSQIYSKDSLNFWFDSKKVFGRCQDWIPAIYLKIWRAFLPFLPVICRRPKHCGGSILKKPRIPSPSVRSIGSIRARTSILKELSVWWVRVIFSIFKTWRESAKIKFAEDPWIQMFFNNNQKTSEKRAKFDSWKEDSNYAAVFEWRGH